jgi:hypothetical protein
MPDSVYTVVEVVGTSSESISKAISRAISKAGETLRHLGWFEVVQIRGSIENDQIREYQVTVKVGFHLRGVRPALALAAKLELINLILISRTRVA